MFAGYSERAVYSEDKDAVDGNVSTHTAFDENVSTVHPFGGYKTWPEARDDFIFIGECSETFGPIHLMTIPGNCPLGINLNTLAVRILSADYQALRVSSEIPNKDAVLLMCDAMTDVHILVNYFVLFDTQARGFVRPVCVAYVTSDKYKLLKTLKLLTTALCQAAASIKHSNRDMCVQELKNLLHDLKFTQNDTDMLKTEAGETNSRKLKTELLAVTLRDTFIMLEKIQQLPNNQDIEEAITRFQDHLKCSDIKSDINDFLNNSNLNLAPYQPKVIKVPLRQNFEKELRPLVSISPGGFLLGLYQLYVTHKFFRRKHEILLLVLKDEDITGNLHFGACIKSSHYNGDINKEAAENTCFNSQVLAEAPSYFDIAEDYNFQYTQPEFKVLLLHLTKRHFPICSEVNVPLNKTGSIPPPRHHLESYTYLETTDITRHLKGDKLQHRRTSITDCKCHGHSLQKIWDAVEILQALDKDRLFTKTLRKFSHVKDILYSLLIGNLCAVIGGTFHERYVRAMVRGLSIFVPRSTECVAVADEWRSTFVNKDEQKNLTVIGLNVPKDKPNTRMLSNLDNTTLINLKNMSYKGQQYSGILLSDLDKRLERVADNGGHAFNLIISILSDIELKVNLWQMTTSEDAFFKFKGYSKCDVNIIKRLASLIKK